MSGGGGRDIVALRRELAWAAVSIGTAVRHEVNALSAMQRCARMPSLLKPPPETAAYPDVVGEQAAIQHLGQLAKRLGYEIRLVVDLSSSTWHSLMPAAHPTLKPAADNHERRAGAPIWCYLDAVDGTLKLSGLSNQQAAAAGEPARLRIINDGAWAVGIAFTDPLSAPLHALALGDFSAAAIVDGNPPVRKVHPTEVVAWLTASGEYTTVEHCSGLHLSTSSCGELPGCFAYMDCFQAHDARTAAASDPRLAVELHQRLGDRATGGAFDVLRSYGNLSALLRTMLGWRGGGGAGLHGAAAGDAAAAADAAAAGSTPSTHSTPATDVCQQVQAQAQEGAVPWLEAQCGAFVVVNENLANLVPSLPVVLGAGGVASLLSGEGLRGRRLCQGRCSVVFAANAELHAAVLRLAAQASSAAGADGARLSDQGDLAAGAQATRR